MNKADLKSKWGKITDTDKLVDDIMQLLKENKFELIGIYEEMTTDPVKDNTERAVFVARKIGTQ